MFTERCPGFESPSLRDPKEKASAPALAFAFEVLGPSLLADRGFDAKADPAGGRRRFLLWIKPPLRERECRKARAIPVSPRKTEKPMQLHRFFCARRRVKLASIWLRAKKRWPEATGFSCLSSLPLEGTRAPEGASNSGSPPRFLRLQSHDGFPRGQQQLRRGIARQLRVLCAYVNRRDCRSHAIDNMICLPFRTHDGR